MTEFVMHAQLELPLDLPAERVDGLVETRPPNREEWVERELMEYGDAVPPASCECERPLVMAGDDPYDEPRCVWCGHRVELGL